MTVFWGLTSVMMVVALLFIVPPLLRSRKTLTVSRDDLNTEVIKTQLGELEADLQAGKLDQAQYEPARKDLERELLYDLSSSIDDLKPRSARSSRWAALVLAVAIPLCAILLYMQLGSKELTGILEQASVSQPASAMRQPAAARSLEAVVIQLVERLRTQPDDPQGWVLLAKSYTALKRFSDAVEAYGNARRLGGDQPELLADYADALVVASGGRFTKQATKLLQRALEIQPDYAKALWLSGHWKYQNGAFDEAIQYWQRVAAQVPEDSPDARVIARQIEQARQKLGMTADSEMQAAVSASSPVTGFIEPAAEKVLQVRVSLDSQLSTQVDPEDTVFIFARAAEGSRMPLAIVRKQVKDLPVTVTLDDSSAMSAAMRLSEFEEVSLTARISRSGNAIPTSGDLQGTVSPVRTQGTEIIDLIIDTTLP